MQVHKYNDRTPKHKPTSRDATLLCSLEAMKACFWKLLVPSTALSICSGIAHFKAQSGEASAYSYGTDRISCERMLFANGPVYFRSRSADEARLKRAHARRRHEKHAHCLQTLALCCCLKSLSGVQRGSSKVLGRFLQFSCSV